MFWQDYVGIAPDGQPTHPNEGQGHSICGILFLHANECAYPVYCYAYFCDDSRSYGGVNVTTPPSV